MNTIVSDHSKEQSVNPMSRSVTRRNHGNNQDVPSEDMMSGTTQRETLRTDGTDTKVIHFLIYGAGFFFKES